MSFALQGEPETLDNRWPTYDQEIYFYTAQHPGLYIAGYVLFGVFFKFIYFSVSVSMCVIGSWM